MYVKHLQQENMIGHIKNVRHSQSSIINRYESNLKTVDVVVLNMFQ